MRKALLVSAALVSLWSAVSAAQTTPALPVVEGPITGPGPMYPGLRPLEAGTEPEAYDYQTEEYFVSGTANGAPYTTRILVRSPEKAKRFSGIVVAESMHSNGFAVTFEPSRLVARKVANGETTRSRPLCAYPQKAEYKGSGSTDDEGNFVCR